MSVSAGVPSARRTLPVATLASVRAQTAALLREHRGALIEVVGLHAIAAVAGLAAPFVVGRLVDEVTAGTAYESAPTASTPTSSVVIDTHATFAEVRLPRASATVATR